LVAADSSQSAVGTDELALATEISLPQDELDQITH
jgi:hypothetical protein